MTGALRAAARHAYAMRHIADQTPQDCLAYLLEEAGEVAKAVRKGDRQNVAEEVADVAVIIDHIADWYGLPTLAELVARKVEADRPRFEVHQ